MSCVAFVTFLQPNEQLVQEYPTSTIVTNGPATVTHMPFISRAWKRKAILLDVRDYIVVTDKLSGALRIEQGPQLFFTGAYEDTSQTRRAFELKKNQYIKLLDQATGEQRVEQGEKIVFPKATETPMGGVQDAVNVDDDTAVLVLSHKSGQQRLVTEPGLFVPGPLDDILEVRKLIHVEQHEVAVVRDEKGTYQFHSGTDTQGTAFFLPPHCELVTMQWSSGTSPEDTARNIVRNSKTIAYKVPVTKIDLRSQYAMFEYKVRTSDNVELLLEGTIFWQVVDVPKMIHKTSDPKGEVWYHARSALIAAVSTVTLEQFMASFNDIVANAAKTDTAFYDDRGVRLHGLEVVRYECADGKTAAVLQEIIQETTNRINRMQKERSENEVEREHMVALIGIERQRKELIEAKTANEKLQASVDGESEGTRLAQNSLAFLQQLGGAVPDDDTRLKLLQFFSEQATMTQQTKNLAQGKATLFLTPQDINLKMRVDP